MRWTCVARFSRALAFSFFALELFVPPAGVRHAVGAPAMFRRTSLEAVARLGCGRRFGRGVFGLEQEVVILWNMLAEKS